MPDPTPTPPPIKCGACLQGEGPESRFYPTCISADRLTSKEAQKAKQCLACILASKWDHAYSDTMNFIHVWMSLSILQSNTLLLHRDHNHSLHQ
ncbi:hypothetical protein ACHAW6_000779 [Cyclotella cf. meneghiniana]